MAGLAMLVPETTAHAGLTTLGWKGAKRVCQPLPNNAGLFWYIQLSEPLDHWLANKIIKALGYGT